MKIFCLAEHADPKQRHYLSLYKMGEGPLYPFWIPYHLPHFETPNAIARVVLFGDDVAPPLGGPVVEVCAVAKRDLKAGEMLDDYGMFMTYGEAVNVEEMSSGRYLPEGLVEGCRLRRARGEGQVLTYDDVELPAGRVADRAARRAVPPLPRRDLARADDGRCDQRPRRSGAADSVNVLVTGHHGYIGSVLAPMLGAAGARRGRSGHVLLPGLRLR